MSFGKLKGKQVWGSSVYRILVETENDRVNADFSGKMTLFERRHEKSKLRFETLSQFVFGVKQQWQSVLSAVQDTRIARWIEEYLAELGIQTSYQTFLDAIRGQYEEVEPIEVSEEENIPLVELPSYISDTQQTMSRGVRRTIKGDLDDAKSMEKLLEKHLHDNKQLRKSNVISRSSFKLPDGSEKGFDDTKNITEFPLSSELLFESGFENKFDHEITNLTISDIIPYDLQIADINILNSNLKKVSEETVDDGLKIVWNISKLGPGESAKIDYRLGKRMLRTILIRDDFDVTLLHTYEDIQRDGNDIWIESKYVFHDKTPIVENVKIIDIIPSDLKLIGSRPEAIEPMAKITTGIKETEITWSYSDVPAQTQFVVVYDLMENPRIFRDIISLVDDKDETIAEIVKIMKPLVNETGYGIIYAIKTFHKIAEELIIQDEIDADYNIIEVHVDIGNVNQTVSNNKKSITWTLKDIPLNETKNVYLKCLGNKKIDMKSFTVTSQKQKINTLGDDQGMTINKRETIIMPQIYVDEIDS